MLLGRSLYGCDFYMSTQAQEILQKIYQTDFNKVNSFIQNLYRQFDFNPKKYNCFKIGHLRKYKKIAGSDLCHSFILFYDAEQNKLIPFMLLPGKKDHIFENHDKTQKIIEQKTELGRGAFGSVKKVMAENGEIYAIKKQTIYLKGMLLIKYIEIINRLSREFSLSRKLNLSKYAGRREALKRIITSSGSQEELYIKNYMLMPLLNGQELLGLFQTKYTTSEQRLVIFWKLAEELAKIHAHGILHRDIKLENVIYDPETKVLKIIDYGLSCDLNPDNVSFSAVGTPDFIAPEIINLINSEFKTPYCCNSAIDIYSLGRNIYMCDIISSSLPIYFSELVMSMHHPDPTKRPTARYVADQLFRIIMMDFYQALSSANVNKIDLMLDAGLDINIINVYDLDLLYFAAAHGDAIMVDILLDKGVSINSLQKQINHQGLSALFIAAAKGHIDVVEILIDRGADINLLQGEGPYKDKTALYIALKYNRYDIVDFLLRNGALDIASVAQEIPYPEPCTLFLYTKKQEHTSESADIYNEEFMHEYAHRDRPSLSFRASM